MSDHPAISLLFDTEFFREEYVQSKTLRRHYLFVDCEKCLTLNKIVGSDYDHYKHLENSFTLPCYWIETQKGEIRVAFGVIHISNDQFLKSIVITHQAYAKIGGNKRSILPMEGAGEPYKGNSALSRMLNHVFSHYDRDFLESLLIASRDDTSWNYLKPKKDFPPINSLTYDK